MATDNPTSRPPKPASIGRFKISLNILIQFIIFLLLLVMLNYLSFKHYKRWDFTRTHFYALSEKTKRVLDGLKKPVKMIVFFSPVSPINADVNNLLKEYQYAAKGKIDIEIVDPNLNLARASELQNLYKFGKQENIVILDYDGSSGHKGRTKFITDRDMVDLDTSGEKYGQGDQITGFKGEQAVTGALLEITDDKPNILYAITGHGESELSGDDFGTIKLYIERENIKVQPLNLQNVDAVPADAGALFIMGAHYDFSDREIKLLKDYWEKKGRLFILLDPNAQQHNPGDPQQNPHLMGFLAEQGIKPDDDRIMRVQMTQVASMAELVRYVTANFIEGSPITKNLKAATGLFQGDTQSLTLDKTAAQAADIRLQELVQANQGYWGETLYNIGPGDPVPIFLPSRDKGQQLYIAASVEKGALKNVQVDSSRMVVTGNCDFISTSSLTNANANLDFTINCIDWLLDRVELIGIAPKDYTMLEINLTDDQMSHILFTTMVLIPGIFGVFGFAVWWRRRH